LIDRFHDCAIANYPQNVPVKNFKNHSILGKDMEKSLQLTGNFGSPCTQMHDIHCVQKKNTHSGFLLDLSEC